MTLVQTHGPVVGGLKCTHEVRIASGDRLEQSPEAPYDDVVESCGGELPVQLHGKIQSINGKR